MATDHSLENGFFLGTYRVQPGLRLVGGPEGEVRLEPKAMEVLLALAGADGATVSREKLIEQVWPRGHVTDDVLNRCIGQIRKALGESPRDARFLNTIPKQGYRLDGVRRSADLSVDEMPGLLVLPFQSLSPSPEDAYLADGLTELLIAKLASVRSLRLISRTSAMALGRSEDTLPAIARRVDARWVVEGSVLISGDQIQVVAQLIDADTDAHVWADTYQSKLSGLLSLQNAVARRIAAKVQGRLLPRVSQDDLSSDALRAYLRALTLKSHRTAPELREARGLLEQLTTSQAEFAPAWGLLGIVYRLLTHYGFEPASDLLPLARQCGERALKLDPDQPSGLVCVGAIRLLSDRDAEGAEPLIRRALEIQPNHDLALINMANICSIRRRFDESRNWCRAALRSDPLNVGVHMNYGDHLILGGAYEDAAELMRHALDLQPDHLPCRLRLAWALALGGRYPEALELVGQLVEEHPGASAVSEYAAMVYGLTGNSGKSIRQSHALRQASGYVSPWSLARAAAGAGQIGDAFGFLERAFAQNSSSLPFLEVTPAFRSLHDDSRWPRLRARL